MVAFGVALSVAGGGGPNVTMSAVRHSHRVTGRCPAACLHFVLICLISDRVCVRVCVCFLVCL